MSSSSDVVAVSLIGDDQELAAIGAAGRCDIEASYGVVRLPGHRFADLAEAAATLDLRDGRPEALGFDLDPATRPRRGRHQIIRRFQRLAGRPQRRPRPDHAGPTREPVRRLNERAQDDRRAGAAPGRQVS